MKLCKDCKYHWGQLIPTTGEGLRKDWCLKHQRTVIDPVRGGKSIQGRELCRDQRRKMIFVDDSICGIDAQFFEPKEPS